MKRRMLCALLALVLCAGLLPAASLAAEAPSQTELPVTETSEITSVPEGTTPPEGSDASDNTDSATVVDTSDDTDTSDTTDVTDDTDASDDTDVSNDTDTSDDADTDTSDDADASDDDADTSDDAGESDDVDAADDTDSADASDEVQSVATTALISDGAGETTTVTTITLGKTVTSATVGAVYNITLPSGIYAVEGTATVQVEAENEAAAGEAGPGPGTGTGPGGYGKTLTNGGLFLVNKASETLRVTCTSAGTLKIADASTSTSVTELMDGTALSLAPSDGTVYRKFTASADGKYLLKWSSFLSVSALGNSNLELNKSTWTAVDLKAGDVLYFELRAMSSGDSFLVQNYNDIPKLTLGKDPQSVKAGNLLRVKEDAGWYVLETEGDVSVSGAESRNGKWYLIHKGGSALLTVSAAGSDATIELRAMEEADAEAMTGSDGVYSGTGLNVFRFTAPEAGTYQLATGGKVYYANGTEITSTFVNLEEGAVLYVLPNSSSTPYQIKNATVNTLALGDEIQISSGESACYRFKAPETGIYGFVADGDVDKIRAIYTSSGESYLSNTYGWTGSYQSIKGSFLFLELKKDDEIDFQLTMNNPRPDSTSQTVKLKFNSLTGMASNLKVGKTVTTASANSAYLLTPEATGLYILSADGNNQTPSNIRALETFAVTTAINGTTAMELEKGKTYLILVGQSGTGVCVREPQAEDITTLVLNEKQTRESGFALFSFTAEKTGFYTITASGCEVSSYDTVSGMQELTNQPGSLGGGGSEPPSPGAVREETYTVALTAGRAVYLLAVSRGGGEGPGGQSKTQEMSICIGEKSADSLEYLQADTAEAYKNLSGEYLFKAPESGLYALSGGNASVTADGNANVKMTNFNSGKMALFYLQKDQTAFITVARGDGSMEHRILSEKKINLCPLPVDRDTEYTDNGEIYSFTAPADGLYMISLLQKNSATPTTYFYDLNLRERTIYSFGDTVVIFRSYICEMKAGQTVYVYPQSLRPVEGTPVEDMTGTETPMGGEPGGGVQPTSGVTFRAEAVTVSDALTEIGTYIGTTDADTREAVQELGTANLTEAMTGSDANEVVDKMGALENDVTDSTIQTDVASDAGISPRVNVVGAKLNTLTKENVTLRVEDGEERTLPADVDWSEEDAIHLTMDLDGVVDADSLAVPVCITLAVPEGMDPEKVRLVHYGAERTEVLEPIAVYEAEDGVWYARFVVGGFSPFALAELAANDDGGSAGGDSGSGTQKPAARGHSPKTGDESRLALWAAVLLLACGGAVLVLKKKHN